MIYGAGSSWQILAETLKNDFWLSQVWRKRSCLLQFLSGSPPNCLRTLWYCTIRTSLATKLMSVLGPSSLGHKPHLSFPCIPEHCPLLAIPQSVALIPPFFFPPLPDPPLIPFPLLSSPPWSSHLLSFLNVLNMKGSPTENIMIPGYQDCLGKLWKLSEVSHWGWTLVDILSQTPVTLCSLPIKKWTASTILSCNPAHEAKAWADPANTVSQNKSLLPQFASDGYSIKKMHTWTNTASFTDSSSFSLPHKEVLGYPYHILSPGSNHISPKVWAPAISIFNPKPHPHPPNSCSSSLTSCLHLEV